MAAPPGGWRDQPWWSLGLLPAAVLLFGSPWSLRHAVAPAEVRIVDSAGGVVAEGFELSRLAEGSASEQGVVVPAPLQLEVILSSEVPVGGLVLQANHHDAFRVSAAGPGAPFVEIWIAPRLEPPQLRTRRSPRLETAAPVSRLRVQSLRGRPFSVSDLRVQSPRVSIPAWCLAPLGVWLVWAWLWWRGSSPALARWRRADLRLALLGAGLAVPAFSLPALAALVVDGAVRLQLERGRAKGTRLWGAPGLLVVLAITVVHALLITRGGESLDRSELLGAAYDSLADSFVAGTTSVELWAIKWEGFRVEGGVTTYFGPLPALLRIPANALAPTFYGRWSRLSCLTAALLSVWGCIAVFHRQLEHNARLPLSSRRALLAICVLGVGLASPLAFMLVAGSIYHEAPLWGLAASLWGVHFALALARGPARPARPFAGLALCAGAALLSRVTFGLPLLAVLGVAGLMALVGARRDGSPPLLRQLLRVAAWSSPALVLLAFQLWYNFDRFGSITTFIDWTGLGYLVEDENSWRIFQEAGTFNPARLPTALVNYFGVRGESLSASLPFFETLRPLRLRPDLYPPLFVDYGISLSVVSGWLVVCALLGCRVLLRPGIPGLARWLALALLAQAGLVLCYYIVSQRYSLDFLPFLVCTSSFFLLDAGRRLRRPRWAIEALGAAVLAGVVATTLSTLSWIPLSAQSTPREYKERVSAAFEAGNAWLGLD